MFGNNSNNNSNSNAECESRDPSYQRCCSPIARDDLNHGQIPVGKPRDVCGDGAVLLVAESQLSMFIPAPRIETMVGCKYNRK